MQLIISVAALLFAMLTFYLQFHSTDHANQQRLIKLVRKVLGTAGKVASYIIVIFVFILSTAGIVIFWSNEEPIQRSEVVMLILHMVNAFMYGYLSFSIPAKAIRDKQTVEVAEV